MIYYLCIYFFSLIISFGIYDKHIVCINNRLLSFLFIGFLIALAGFRYNISTDYWHYYNSFISNIEETRFEFLFKKLMIYSKKLFNSYNVFVFIVALLALSLKGWYFSKLYNPFLAIFIYICIYFFDADFNIIRQGLGIGFVYLAIEGGKKKNPFQFLILLLIACGFHISYLILLPFYLICGKKINFSLKKVIFIIVILFVIRITIFNSFLRFVQQLLRSSGNPLILQLVRYLGVKDFVINFSLLRRLFFVCLYIYLFGTKDLDIYFILYFFSFLLSLLLTGNEMFLHRLSLCFDIFSIPLFANRRIPLTKKNILGIIVFIISLTVLYFKPMSSVLPYQTYL